ncbi:MAG: hypothetical protein AB4050_07510 [Synechococcus sp.]
MPANCVRKQEAVTLAEVGVDLTAVMQSLNLPEVFTWLSKGVDDFAELRRTP